MDYQGTDFSEKSLLVVKWDLSSALKRKISMCIENFPRSYKGRFDRDSILVDNLGDILFDSFV